MIQHLIILLGNCFLSFNIAVFLSKKIGQSNKILRFGVLVAFFSVLSAVCFKFYQDNKQDNYYDIMNINKNFTNKELRSSFRNYMKIYHPDKAKDENLKREYEEKYIKIQNINGILLNQEFKQYYDTFGAMDFPLSKGNTKKDIEDRQKFKTEAEAKQFILQLDLYFFYALSTMVVIVLTEEGQAKYSKIQCFITLGLFFGYDWLLVKGYQNQYILQQVDILEFLLPATIFPERSFILRLMFGVVINFFRSSAFVSDDKSHEKLFTDSKIVAQKYMKVAQQIEKNPEIVKNPEKLKEIIGKGTDSQFDQLIQTIDKNINQEKSSKTGILYKLKKFIKSILSWVLFAMSMYYMYSLFMNSDNKEK